MAPAMMIIVFDMAVVSLRTERGHKVGIMDTGLIQDKRTPGLLLP